MTTPSWARPTTRRTTTLSVRPSPSTPPSHTSRWSSVNLPSFSAYCDGPAAAVKDAWADGRKRKIIIGSVAAALLLLIIIVAVAASGGKGGGDSPDGPPGPYTPTDTPWRGLRLPNSVVPTSQTIELFIDLDSTPTQFWGTVNVTLRVLQPIDALVLHAGANLQTSRMWPSSPTTARSQPLTAWYHSAPQMNPLQQQPPQQQFFYLVLNFTQRLPAQQAARLNIAFRAPLTAGGGGLFLTTYVNGTGHTVNMAATQFESIGARRALPVLRRAGVQGALLHRHQRAQPLPHRPVQHARHQHHLVVRRGMDAVRVRADADDVLVPPSHGRLRLRVHRAERPVRQYQPQHHHLARLCTGQPAQRNHRARAHRGRRDLALLLVLRHQVSAAQGGSHLRTGQGRRDGSATHSAQTATAQVIGTLRSCIVSPSYALVLCSENWSNHAERTDTRPLLSPQRPSFTIISHFRPVFGLCSGG